MNSKLFELFKLPFVSYQSGDTSIWTDAHISKQLLAAHLDPDFEGASRNHSFISDSAAWIAKLLPPSEYPALLDIGCGPGIYAEKFSLAGYQVTGIDFSERSIGYAARSAQEKELKIQYMQLDYLRAELPSAYDLAAFIYCDYGALSHPNRAAVLHKIYQSLRTGGMLLLDVFSGKQYEDFEESTAWETCPQGRFWSAAPHLLFSRACRYSENTSLRQSVILTENDARCFYLWDTYFTKESLTNEAQEAGFKVCAVYGDVCGAPYTPDSSTIAILLKKS